MKIELTKSQISYLKSLDSKKKKRKFLLDCLVENVCVEETQSPKPNYSPEEIELVKHNINQREVSEQGSELLKFDMLEKDVEVDFLCEIQNYLESKSIILEINEIHDLEKIFLKYHKNAN